MVGTKGSVNRRKRLANLISIGMLGSAGKQDPKAEALAAALAQPISQREALLKTFFDDYIHGGWITDQTAEDQEFLLNALQQSESFWFDW